MRRNAILLCVTPLALALAAAGEDDLSLLRRLAPNKAFDQWLERTGERIPEFSKLPSQPFAQDPLLVMQDGRPHRIGKDEWPARRRELELLAEKWLLGRAPPAPNNLRAVVENKGQDEKNRPFWKVRLEFGPDHRAVLHCWFYPPKVAGRRPVYLCDNRRYIEFGADAYDESGFGLCIYNATDPAYVPEKKDQSAEYADLFGPEYDWSAFRRRGWSASRAVDWLVTLDVVDPKQIYIGGHSRSAKQSLACAAFDPRIAGVIASSPGSGGSLAYRYCDGWYGGEAVELLTGSFPDWVLPRARFFAGRENKLPTDSHILYALVAPRPVLMSTAWNDGVENTWSVEQTYQLTRGVYDMLDRGANLALRYRPGPHPPDEDTYDAHSDFLEAAAKGQSIEKLFPYQPIHPWNYEKWFADRGKAVKQIDPAAPVQDRIRWLLGDGPPYMTAEIKIGQGETDEQLKTLRRGSIRGKLKFDDVSANLYFAKPREPGRKMPGIVFLAPFHTSTGYIPSYRSGDPLHARLAESGFVVLAFDPIGTGGRQLERRDFYSRHPDWSLMGKMVLDARHAVDALRAVAEVDQKRFYLVGFGMGGMTATLTAALDDRVAGAVSIAGWTPFRADTDGKGTGGIRRWSHLYGFLPRLGQYVGREAEVPLDFDQILSAAAPRSMLVVEPTLDWHATASEVATAVENARRAYREKGAEDKLKLLMPEDWCRLTNAMESEVIEWLKAQAK